MTNWVLWLVIGGITIVGGVFALVNPFAATLSVELLVGALFLFSGLVSFLLTFQEKDWKGVLWSLFVSIASIIVGVMMLQNPLAGIISLTLAIAMLFSASGLFKILFAFSWRDSPSFWAILLSGIVSIVLAGIIFMNFPESSQVTLGILLGIDLIFYGIAFCALAFALKSNELEN